MTQQAAKAFDRLSKAILSDYFAQFPQLAVAAGLHDYDGRVTDLSPGTLDDWAKTLKGQTEALAAVDLASLDPERRLDAQVLQHAVGHALFKMEDRRLFRRSPLDYVDLVDPTSYVKRRYAPLVDRAAALARHLSQIPRVLAEARNLLELPLPAPDVQTAAALMEGTATLIRTGLDDALVPLEGHADRLLAEVRQAREAAEEAVTEFALWLRSLEATEGTISEFALGAVALQRMLATGEAVTVDLNKLLSMGEADLARNQQALAAVAHAVDPEGGPDAALRGPGARGPDADDLVAATQAVVAELQAWLSGQGIVDVPEGGELEVQVSPPHLRWAFAWMDSPGAFEQATESYFYVTPPEPSWSKGRSEEWLTKFAPGRLRVVAIHEAYPGHFVHHLHVRRHASGVRRYFGAYSAWEAWAHYGEQLAIEAGYRPDDLGLRIAQLGEAILRDVRLVAALGMHAGGMTVDRAAALFEQHAYLAPAAARAEAVRGTFDPGYCNYTLGKLMLLKMREDARAAAKAAGEPFILRAFHDRYLAYGPAPLPLVREAMLGPGAGPAL